MSLIQFLTKKLVVMPTIVAMLTGASAAAAECQALVKVSNDLWFARSDGSLSRRLTTDGKPKYAVDLSADGRLVAYTGGASASDISLIDSAGRHLSTIDVTATDAITGVAWMGASLLRAQEHVSPRSSVFHFIDSTDVANPRPVSRSEGASCAYSPNGKYLACTEENAIVLQGKFIYELPSAFSSGKAVQTLSVPIGSKVWTSTSPAFAIEVPSIVGNTIGLRLTSPDGSVQEYYENEGGLYVAHISDLKADSAFLFGLLPQITDRNSRVVSIQILQSTTGELSFEGNLAWDMRGHRLATVETTATGQRYLTIINRELGLAALNKGALLMRELIPIDGPIKRVEFISDTHIRVTGAHKIFDKDIPAQGKVRAGTDYFLTQAMPEQLNILDKGSTKAVKVYGWSCN